MAMPRIGDTMTSVLRFNQTIRNVRRYAEILSVLVRYGFGDIIQQLRLDLLVEKGLSLVGRPVAESRRLPRQVRLRKVMEELGPTFIKLGQVLSTRPDLIPPDWAAEFRLLQDSCPQLDYQVIRQRLEEQFPGRVDELFQSIEPQPLAAASMAQTHRAVLKDGRRIVLKVLRPGIRETTATDMEILRALAHFVEQHFANLGYSPTEVVSEFARELRKEVDLTHEGKATDRLRQSFEEDEGVCFPQVYWEATTQEVLALEEIQGILLSRVAEGQLSVPERRALVANGARAVLRQCLELGFFHADPHPGNLFALPGGRICFIDCGMTGQLDPATTEQLTDLVAGVVTGDVETVSGVIATLTDADLETLEDRAFRADVRDLVAHFESTPLERLNVAALLDEFFAMLRAHHLRCPGDMVLLIKAISTIESVGRQLDPGFEIVPFARPFLERLLQNRYSLGAFRRRLTATLMKYTELASGLPGELRPLLTQLRRGRFAVNLEHRGLNRLTHSIDRASRTVALALLVAALLIGSSILVLAARGPAWNALVTVGLVGYGLAALLILPFVLWNRGDREE